MVTWENILMKICGDHRQIESLCKSFHLLGSAGLANTTTSKDYWIFGWCDSCCHALDFSWISCRPRNLSRSRNCEIVMTVEHVSWNVELNRSLLKLGSIVSQTCQLSHSSTVVNMELIFHSFPKNRHLIAFLEASMSNAHSASLRSNGNQRRVCILRSKKTGYEIGNTRPILSDARTSLATDSVISICHVNWILFMLTGNESNSSCWHDVESVHVCWSQDSKHVSHTLSLESFDESLTRVHFLRWERTSGEIGEIPLL